MSSKKQQQQQKQKLRALKKKKVAQAKLESARKANAEEGAEDRSSVRPDFGSKNPTGTQSARSSPKMHRPQGG